MQLLIKKGTQHKGGAKHNKRQHIYAPVPDSSSSTVVTSVLQQGQRTDAAYGTPLALEGKELPLVGKRKST